MAYLGNAPVVGDSTNSFKLLDDIASFTLTFDATDTSVVSISNDTLSFANHRFITGQKVTYTDGGGTAIGGLTDGTSYFIIKVDQSTIKLATNASNAASSTAIDLTSGAVGGSHTLKVAFDGVNTKFKATHSNGIKASISRAGQISLSINGVIQQPQDTSNPTVGYGVEPDSTIVFSTAPVATDKVFGTFIGEVAASFDITDNTVDNFTGDGSTTIFNLSREVPSSQDVLVTLDGVTQHPSDTSTTRSYSVINQALTFVSAPDTGVAIQARHIGFAGATTSEVTGFYGRTGNVALKSTDDISVQNISGVGATFTGNVNIEGVLTYEDVTNVDSIGIITARAGVLVGSGITLSKDGDGFFTGIVTATSFSGSIDLVSDTSPQLGGNLDVNTKNILFGDSSDGSSDDALIFGAGSDLRIYHDGSINVINAATSNAISFRYGGSEQFFIGNGEFKGGDNKKIKLGTGDDLQIFHNGTNSFISNTTGIIQIDSDDRVQVNATEFRVKNAGDTETIAKFIQNGAVELYYDNDKKFETASIGVYSKSIMPSSHETYDIGQNLGRWNDIYIADNGKLRIGQGNDLQIYHNGSNSYIDDGSGTGALIFKSNTYSFRNAADNEQIATFNENGAVELYYNNTKRIETTDGAMNVSQGSSTFCNFHHDGGNSGIRIAGPSASSGANLVFANNYDNSNSDEWAIQLDGASDDLLFKEGGVSGNEKVRIQETGGISFNGDTATANALDDYEEGTYTPVVYYDSVNNHTYSEQIGTYTKIGNFVFGNIVLTFDDQASSGQVGFSLPFTSSNASGTRTAGYFIYQDGLNIPSGQGSNHLILYGGQNSSAIYAYYVGSTNNSELGTSATQLTHSHTSSHNTLRMVFHYRTA